MSIFYFSFLAVQLNLHSYFVVFSLLSCVCVCSSIYFLIGKFHMHSVDLEPTSPRPHHSSHYPGRKYQLSYSSLEFVCVLILFLIYFYFHKAVFQGICSYRLLYPYWSSIISHCLLYQKQVRIVHEAMKFPLWLHGRTVTTVRVVSTFPKKGVGKMISSIPVLTQMVVLFGSTEV